MCVWVGVVDDGNGKVTWLRDRERKAKVYNA